MIRDHCGCVSQRSAGQGKNHAYSRVWGDEENGLSVLDYQRTIKRPFAKWEQHPRHQPQQKPQQKPQQQQQQQKSYPDNSSSGLRFKATFEPHTWVEANELCRTLGMRLATVRSAVENAAATRMAETVCSPYYTSRQNGWDLCAWIGLNDFRREGHLEWVKGAGAAEFRNFLAGEPNNAGGHEDGVAVCWFEGQANGKWIDYSNADRLPCTLCEAYKREEPQQHRRRQQQQQHARHHHHHLARLGWNRHHNPRHD